jgi:hypothetical protein
MTFTRLRAHVALATLVAVVPASLATLTAPSVWAQKGAPSKKDLEAAKKAFFEGLDFEEKKDWKNALDRFEQVAKVRMTPQVRFHLALCKENLNMLIEAVHDFELAESDAKAEKVAEVMKEAPEHAAAIKPKIPKLTIKVPADLEGVSVTLDGNPIDPKGGEETLVNPGTHKIEATAEKRATYAKEITLEVGESKTITVKLPLLNGEKDDSPPPDEPPPKETPKPSGGGIPTTALIAGGIGAAALIGAGIFALKRSSIASDLDGKCGGDPKACPADQQSSIDSGKTYTTLTNVFLVVGVVGIGAGVVLWVTAPKDKDKSPPAAAIRLVPSAPGANVGGLSLSGAF